MKGLTRNEVLSLDWKQVELLKCMDGEEEYILRCIYEGKEYHAIGHYWVGDLNEVTNIVYVVPKPINKFSQFYNDYLK